MAAAVLQEEENMDRGGRRKRKERTGVTAKEILWAVGDRDLETTVAKEAMATKRKRREAVTMTMEAYILSRWREEPAAKEDVNRGRSRGRPRAKGGKGDGERPRQQRRWAEGGTGREEKIDGEGWLRRRHRIQEGEGEDRDRWSRKGQVAALKLNEERQGCHSCGGDGEPDEGENRREEGRRIGVDGRWSASRVNGSRETRREENGDAGGGRGERERLTSAVGNEGSHLTVQKFFFFHRLLQ